MTMALPMSCTSPWTVPSTMMPLASAASPSRAALVTSVAPAMASALIMSSGRKTSPLSKRSPTSWMPLTKPFCMMSAGAMPSARARCGDILGRRPSALTMLSAASW